MGTDTYILSCDWGTSSFRLRLVATDTGAVKSEVTSQQGIAAMYAAYSQALADKNLAAHHRGSFYTDYLHSQIQLLASQTAEPLSGITVIISGMASASIGMMELPYAALPFSLDGTHALTARIKATENFPHDLLLISGVSSADDVMRGEETQLIGLAAKITLQEGICIFPGTHSKHVYINHKQVTDFKTYMTGELFQTIAAHTILKASVEQSAEETFEKHEDVFRQGIISALNKENLLHSVFTVRTAELFKKFTKSQNYYYLSGILIGQELLALLEMPHQPIYLCCGSNLLPFYRIAIDCIKLSSQTTIISGQIIDRIVIEGQLQLFRLNN